MSDTLGLSHVTLIFIKSFIYFVTILCSQRLNDHCGGGSSVCLCVFKGERERFWQRVLAVYLERCEGVVLFVAVQLQGLLY